MCLNKTKTFRKFYIFFVIIDYIILIFVTKIDDIIFKSLLKKKVKLKKYIPKMGLHNMAIICFEFREPY